MTTCGALIATRADWKELLDSITIVHQRRNVAIVVYEIRQALGLEADHAIEICQGGRMSEAEWLALVPGDVIGVPHLSLIGKREYFANIPVYSQRREKFSSSEAIMGGKAVRVGRFAVELFFRNNNLGRAIA